LVNNSDLNPTTGECTIWSNRFTTIVSYFYKWFSKFQYIAWCLSLFTDDVAFQCSKLTLEGVIFKLNNFIPYISGW